MMYADSLHTAMRLSKRHESDGKWDCNHKILLVQHAQEKLGETISEEQASANWMF